MDAKEFGTAESGGRLTVFGREWRMEPRSELAASAVRLPHFEGPEHAHPEAQVAILLEGTAATFRHRGLAESVRSPIPAGSFAYIPPGELHVIEWHGTTELLNLYWEENFLRELADQNGSSLRGEPAFYRIDPAIQSVGRIVMDDFIWTGTLSMMMIDHGRALVASRLFRLSEQASRRSPTGLLSEKRLQNAIDAMTASPEKSFTLIDLARLCHASVFHFSRSFTARLGCAPFAFQRHLRIQKARELLSQTDLSIEAVSYAVGIESPTSFARLFRRFAGLSPRDFRRLNSVGHARKNGSLGNGALASTKQLFS